MSMPQHLASIALAASLIFFQAAPAIAVKQDSNCPANIALEGNQRLYQIGSTIQHLTDFISGKAIPDVPLSALFVVDLNSETAIQNRIRELQAQQTKSQVLSDLSASYLACAKISTSLAELDDKVKLQQLLLNRLRLDFLTLPQERRNGLIRAHIERQKQADTVNQLAEAQNAAGKLQKDAALSGATAEELAKSAASLDLREIAAQRALLEKSREALGRLQAEMVSELQNRAQVYQQTSKNLSALAAVTMNRDASKPLPEAYWETVSIWRELVDRIFERIATPGKVHPTPDIPRAPSDLLSRLKDSEEAAQYLSLFQKTETLKSQLESSRLQRFENERNDLYRLLLDAGQLRSTLLQENLRAEKGV